MSRELQVRVRSAAARAAAALLGAMIVAAAAPARRAQAQPSAPAAPAPTPAVSSGPPARAPKRTETPEEFEERITAELRGRTPAAADLFVEANAARRNSDHLRAVQLYARVYEADPAFVHALRRQCGEETTLGRRDDALAHCRAAVAQEASAENLGTLSLARLTSPADRRNGTWSPSPTEVQEAARAVDAAIGADHLSAFAWTTSCNLSMFTQEIERLRACVDTLQRIAPDEAGTHVYASILATSEERWSDAARELDRARAAGLDEAEYRDLRRQERAARPPLSRMLPTVAWPGADWLPGLALVLAAAWRLRAGPLKAVSRAPAESAGGDGPGSVGEIRGVTAAIRRVYSVVLWLCCAYYYISLPLLFGGILVVGG